MILSIDEFIIKKKFRHYLIILPIILISVINYFKLNLEIWPFHCSYVKFENMTHFFSVHFAT